MNFIDDFSSENPLTKSFVETDENFQSEESASYTNDEKTTSEIDRNEQPWTLDEFADAQSKPDESDSSTLVLTGTTADERKATRSQSDTTKTELPHEETSYQRRREEELTSSFPNPTEENNATDPISSATTTDPQLNEFLTNNSKISRDDLQSFIRLFLEKKQTTGLIEHLLFLSSTVSPDPSINWMEFRDIFLPIVNHGYYSKTDVQYNDR